MRFISPLVAIVLIFYPSHVFADVNDLEKNIVLEQTKLAVIENPAFLYEKSNPDKRDKVWPL